MSLKEKGVEWALASNEYIKAEAKKYNLPVIKLEDRKSYLDKIKKLIR